MSRIIYKLVLECQEIRGSTTFKFKIAFPFSKQGHTFRILEHVSRDPSDYLWLCFFRFSQVGNPFFFCQPDLGLLSMPNLQRTFSTKYHAIIFHFYNSYLIYVISSIPSYIVYTHTRHTISTQKYGTLLEKKPHQFLDLFYIPKNTPWNNTLFFSGFVD